MAVTLEAIRKKELKKRLRAGAPPPITMLAKGVQSEAAKKQFDANIKANEEYTKLQAMKRETRKRKPRKVADLTAALTGVKTD